MKIALQFIISSIIFFPLLIFIISFVFLRKRGKSNVIAFRLSSDLTTLILFFSVPLSIYSVLGGNYHIIVFIVAILIAIICTYIEWRTKKEMHILPLLKMVWRIYFILLVISYILIWGIGLVGSIIEYMT